MELQWGCLVHAHNHACQVNRSASMSCTMQLPHVAIQLKFNMTASETDGQADTYTNILHVQECTASL